MSHTVPEQFRKTTPPDKFEHLDYVKIDDEAQDPLTKSILESAKLPPKQALEAAMEERKTEKARDDALKDELGHFGYSIRKLREGNELLKAPRFQARATLRREKYGNVKAKALADSLSRVSLGRGGTTRKRKSCKKCGKRKSCKKCSKKRSKRSRKH